MNRPSHIFNRYRPSFTLVELLVAISIIGVMVGMVLFSLAGARQDVNISRTRHTIEKLNAIILQEWEEFRYRAVNMQIDPQWLRPVRQASNPTMAGQPPLSPREGARLRLMILRDLMRMELPDRVTDVWYPPTAYKAALYTANNSTGVVSDDVPYYAGALGIGGFPGRRYVPPRYNIYRIRLPTPLVTLASPYTGPVTPLPAALPPSINGTNQGAEWLYQIVATSTYQGGSALEAFRPQEIGDTDNDGMPEFIDAWGNPIFWLRWPASYDSPLNNKLANPDPMDPLRTDWRWSDPGVKVKPWLLVPLIISAGPDGVFDIAFDRSPAVVYATQVWAGGTNSPVHSAGDPYYFPDPYVGSYAGTGLGAKFDEDGDGTFNGVSDNITNHDLLLE